MRRAVAWLGVSVLACAPGLPAPRGGGKSSFVESTNQKVPDELERALALCVEETNKYRRQLGRSPLARSRELEGCAVRAAVSDHATRKPHEHFTRTSGCDLAMAENEIPWWPLEYAGGVEQTIARGIADMFAEGPGGGHYENIVGPYGELGCGIYIEGELITVVQNFR